MRRNLAKALGVVVFVALGYLAYGFLAPLKVHYVSDLKPDGFSYPDAKIPETPFVGLALSGGGARAAVFAAAGMRALAERGLLDQVTHVSSVSGGGFTASYWALNPVPACPGEACARYFTDMLAAVAHDYQSDIHANQALSPMRLLSPSRRLLSLEEAIQDKGFLTGRDGDPARFEDLPANRSFFFNAVSYDTGRRFVLSNLALPHPDAEGESRLPPGIRALSFSDPATERRAPPDFPVSLAVATSAAFPPYVGPATLHIKDEHWHLGDGGLMENSGVETLREAIYARDSIAPATIYSFDAGKRLDPNLKKPDISVFSRDLVQMVDVLFTYASDHRETLSPILDAANGMDINLVAFNYLDVAALVDDLDVDPYDRTRWTSWDAWPQCPERDRTNSTIPAERLEKIPTSFSITDCDQALIAEAAGFLVDHWAD